MAHAAAPAIVRLKVSKEDWIMRGVLGAIALHTTQHYGLTIAHQYLRLYAVRVDTGNTVEYRAN